MDFPWEWLLVLLLALVNGVFAMAELAVVSARRSRLLALQRQGQRGAAEAIALQDAPQRFLPTVQIGITLVGILAGAIGATSLAGPLGVLLDRLPFLLGLGEAIAFAIVVLCITALNMILGELVPKQMALRQPERWAAALAPLLVLVGRVAAPVIWLLSCASAAVLRLIGRREAVPHGVTTEEVKAVLAEGVQAGALQPNERQMIERVLRLADRPVRALMTPRPEVAWIAADAPREDLVARLRSAPHTRFVVTDRRMDHVLGVVAAKDLLDQMLAGGPLNLASVLRQPAILPDTLPALDAMERLRADAVGIALVLDEYGSFEGVVTASDLLEAIVGELGPAPASEKAGTLVRYDGSVLLDGMMPLDELRGRLKGFEPPPAAAQYHTVAGLMIALLLRVPKEGDRIAHSGWRFEIVDMDGRRVDKVLAVRENSTPILLPPPSRSAG